jgi:hypothetical protein
MENPNIYYVYIEAYKDKSEAHSFPYS